MEGGNMDTARIFTSGRSQAVRLPKDYRFEGTEVAIKHFGSGVLLLPKNNPWLTMLAGLDEFEPGLKIERNQPEMQVRPEVLP
jgi:antitoxin VapB